MANFQQQITVQQLKPPQPGKKYASIKCELGWISLHESKMNLFQQGEIANIEYSVTPEGYKNFVARLDAPQPAPISQAGPQAAKPARSGASNDMLIFVTGVVGRAMGSGNFVATDIPMLTMAARDAFENALKFQRPQQDAPPPTQLPPRPLPRSVQQVGQALQRPGTWTDPRDDAPAPDYYQDGEDSIPF